MNDNCSGNSSTTDIIKLNESVNSSEPSEKGKVDIVDANNSNDITTNNENVDNKSNKNISSNEIKPPTRLILQQLKNGQKSQQ